MWSRGQGNTLWEKKFAKRVTLWKAVTWTWNWHEITMTHVVYFNLTMFHDFPIEDCDLQYPCMMMTIWLDKSTTGRSKKTWLPKGQKLRNLQISRLSLWCSCYVCTIAGNAFCNWGSSVGFPKMALFEPPTIDVARWESLYFWNGMCLVTSMYIRCHRTSSCMGPSGPRKMNPGRQRDSAPALLWSVSGPFQEFSKGWEAGSVDLLVGSYGYRLGQSMSKLSTEQVV